MPTLRDLAAVQLTWNGTCYVWGGIVPGCHGKGADCSGINWAALEVLGVPGPDPTDAHRGHRTAQSLFDWCQAAGTTCSPAEARATIGSWGFIGRDGKIHHIVTSLGNGSTIEAANKRAGVGVFRWDGRGIQLAGYCPALVGQHAAPASSGPSLRQVIDLARVHTRQRPFQRGDGRANGLDASVRLIQAALEAAGIAWVDGPTPQTGEYDEATARHVQWYQHVRDLPVPPLAWSAVDPITFDAMYPIPR